MNKSVLALVVLVAAASLSVAGCQINLPTTSSSSPTPTITTSTPDHTQQLKSLAAGWGWPLPDLQRVSGNTYVGTWNNTVSPGEISPGQTEKVLFMSTYMFQTFDSEKAAKENYDHAISKKMSEAFKMVNGTLMPSITAKEHWSGYRLLGENCLIMYVYDNNSQQWVVTTSISTSMVLS